MTIDGTYKLTIKTPVGAQRGELVLASEGARIHGTLKNSLGETRFDDGSVQGADVAFTTKIPTPLGKLRARVKLAVTGNGLQGEAKLPLGSARIDGQLVTEKG